MKEPCPECESSNLDTIVYIRDHSNNIIQATKCFVDLESGLLKPDIGLKKENVYYDPYQGKRCKACNNIFDTTKLEDFTIDDYYSKSCKNCGSKIFKIKNYLVYNYKVLINANCNSSECDGSRNFTEASYPI